MFYFCSNGSFMPLLFYCILTIATVCQYTDSDDGEYPRWALFCAALLISAVVGPIVMGLLLYYIRRWRVRRSYLMDTHRVAMADVRSECPGYKSVDSTDCE